MAFFQILKFHVFGHCDLKNWFSAMFFTILSSCGYAQSYYEIKIGSSYSEKNFSDTPKLGISEKYHNF